MQRRCELTRSYDFVCSSRFDIEDIPITPNAKDYPKDIDASVSRIHAAVAELENAGYDSSEILREFSLHPSPATVHECKYVEVSSRPSVSFSISTSSDGDLRDSFKETTQFELQF